MTNDMMTINEYQYIVASRGCAHPLIGTQPSQIGGSAKPHIVGLYGGSSTQLDWDVVMSSSRWGHFSPVALRSNVRNAPPNVIKLACTPRPKTEPVNSILEKSETPTAV